MLFWDFVFHLFLHDSKEKIKEEYLSDEVRIWFAEKPLKYDG